MYDFARFLQIRSAYGPAWTAEGELLFLSEMSGAHQVWRLAAPGQWPTQATWQPERVLYAHPDPAGRRFLLGSDTLFIGVGTDNAFVDFSRLKGNAVQVSDDRLSATITLGHAQLEPATLDVHESYVYAQQQGLFTRINEFLSGNPNSQQALYELAQKQIQAAAAKSPLVADAERNTKTMLVGLLQSLGFKNVTVNYADSATS